MNFTKSELEMLYQYAAPTKEETLAGLKEIVPVLERKDDLLSKVPPVRSQHSVMCFQAHTIFPLTCFPIKFPIQSILRTVRLICHKYDIAC